MLFLYIILSLAAGFAIGYLIQNGKRQGIAAKADMLAARLNDTKAEQERQTAALKEEFNRQTDALERNYKEQLRQQAETQKEMAEAQKEMAKQQFNLLKEQLTTASETVLKNRSDDLAKINSEQLSKIINPLNERIAQMKEAVEKNRQIQTETTASLNTAINRTVEQTEKLGKSTDHLVSALSYDNQYQGSFGELQLRQLLESMDFERGIQFEEQVTIKDDTGETVLHDTTGSRMQPDVVLHFPDKRDIIIDAKTSMNAFLRYNDGTLSDSDRQQALKDHITAVKSQVKSLSKKDYWRQYNQKGIKLDFVVMFIPSEGAFNLATSKDPSLWTEAIKQGVFITGPQNLYALLRLLEMSWKQVAQMKNQQKIIDCADEIVKRVQIFYKRFTDVQKALENTQNCFDELNKSLMTSGQSIITSANKLVKYGAREDTSRNRPSLPRMEENLLPENISGEEDQDA